MINKESDRHEKHPEYNKDIAYLFINGSCPFIPVDYACIKEVLYLIKLISGRPEGKVHITEES